MNRKIAVIVAILAITVLSLAAWNAIILNRINHVAIETPNNEATFTTKVDSTITFWQYGKIKYQFSTVDPLTNLGQNLTFAKLTGYGTSAYNLTTYPMNCTFVSIGDGSPGASSTILPGEWAKVSGTLHDLVYDGFNITGVITAPAGPNSANCMGINYEDAAMGFHDLYAYTTFAEVTGIDDTFTITCELQVSATSA